MPYCACLMRWVFLRTYVSATAVELILRGIPFWFWKWQIERVSLWKSCTRATNWCYCCLQCHRRNEVEMKTFPTKETVSQIRWRSTCYFSRSLHSSNIPSAVVYFMMPSFFIFFSFSGVHLKIPLPAETSLVKWWLCVPVTLRAALLSFLLPDKDVVFCHKLHRVVTGSTVVERGMGATPVAPFTSAIA